MSTSPEVAELRRWKRIAAYLASCNAATLVGMPKYWSKSDKERFRSMAQKSVDYLEGKAEPPVRVRPDPEEEVEDAIKRCHKNLAATFMCSECKSEGFAPSATTKGCTFCDGTAGGNSPNGG